MGVFCLVAALAFLRENDDICLLMTTYNSTLHIMKQNFSKVLRALVVSAAVVFSFASCKGDEPSDPGNNGDNTPEPTFTMVPVDLGLSVKWAESNLGATVATESGNTYAGTSDPVPGLCGKEWRMPTKEEFEELVDPANCSVEEAMQGDVKGYRITSKKNGNSIFLPVSGDKGYWSSTGCTKYPAAWCLEFTLDNGHQGSGKRVNSNGANKISSESDLTYEYWNESGGNNSATIYPDGSFKLSWNNPNDVLAEVGLKFNVNKKHAQIGRFAADYNFTKEGGHGGTFSSIGIYGWSGSPKIVEFYIIEDWFGNRFTYGAQKKGEYIVDGDSYELYTSFKTGTNVFGPITTFDQYYGIRKSGRQKGHVDITAHFREWEKKGLSLGNLERVVVLAEVTGGTGSVDYTYVNIYPRSDYASWLAENELSGADAAWDATPSKWGGEVTNAYIYNRGKENPIRFPAGWDPYLNLREKDILQAVRPVTK